MARLLLVAFCSLLLPSSLLAAKCKITEPEYVINTNTSWTAMPVPGAQISPLVTKEFNGVGTTNFLHVTMLPNQANPPHRHSGEEYVFVHKGKMMLTYWVPGMPEKVRVELLPGSFHYIPANGIHDVVTADVSCEFLVASSPGPFKWEVFDSWPKSFDVEGHFVDVLGSMECPPASATIKEHNAHSAEL